ncbi:MAG TPA: PH domain-containing protein [Salinimicrobium sp.]|nr:PH domain-containing protein [Salinimicrobium sp.]
MASIESENFQNLQIDVARLPRAEEVEGEKLSPKYLHKLNISTTISFIVLVGFATTANYFIPWYEGYFLLTIAGLLLIFAFLFYNNSQLAKRNSYTIRERDIIYKRGFIFEKTTVVPFNRVQHVSTNRGVLDKMLNLSTLKIFTAGGSGSDVNIPGLSPDIATTIKEELSNRIASHV